MSNQILVGKSTSNHLGTFICNSFNQISVSDTSNDTKAKATDKSPKSKHRRYKTQNGETSDSNTSESPENKVNKAVEQNVIPDALKRKLIRSIESIYEINIKRFSNAAWAYVDIPEDVYLDKESMYFLNLLFGPENLKRKLFNRLRKQKEHGLKGRSRKKNNSREANMKNDTNLNENNNNCSDTHETNSTPKLANTIKSSKHKLKMNGNYYKKTELIKDDITQHIENKLKNVCASFFERHGLVVKVRKLPLGYINESNLSSRRTARYYGSSSYPSYHFISRQRRHIIEQLMRTRSFFNTEYNTYSELRNFRSPFLLLDPHSNFLKYLQDIKRDLNDTDFTGLYISLTTLPYKSKTELGDVRRSKLIAWCLVEILANNERCLNCLWINPVISATGTTDLLRAFMPFIIVTSFSVRVPNINEEHKKVFYIWLADFDHFPRQALILLASPYRFALEKHFDYSEEYQDHTYSSSSSFYSKYLYENNISTHFSFGHNYPLRDSMTDGNPFSDNGTSGESPLIMDSYTINDVISTPEDDDEEDDDEEDVDESDEYMDVIFKKYLNEYVPSRIKDAKTCKCHEGADWNDMDKVILSCSQEMMVDSIPRWLQLIRKYSSYLEEDIENIIFEKENEVETGYEIKAAEFAKLETNHIQDLLLSLYGNKWTLRVKLKYKKIFKHNDLTRRSSMLSSESENRKNKR